MWLGAAGDARLNGRPCPQVCEPVWFNFLLTLTSSLGLLALVVAVTDFVMLNIMPHRRLYEREKYVVSEVRDPGCADSTC